jgi:hypothetical protein
VPLIGCKSHQLNLARRKLIENERANMEVVDKVDDLMISLKTLKGSSILRKKTKLRPEKRNVTRWSSEKVHAHF